MSVLRGRLLFTQAGSISNITLSDFCDVVWLEIWDDYGPMADHITYRRIVTELFIEGKDPYHITYEVTEYDKKGKPHKKTKRLAESPSGRARAQLLVSEASVLEQWKARSAELKAAKETAGATKS